MPFPTPHELEIDSLPLVESVDRTAPVCCGNLLGRLVVPGLAVLACLAIGVAAYYAGRAHRSENEAAMRNIPLLHANAAVSSEKFSCATGPVTEEADALFVLDHNSGLLQCSVVYPRLGRFMAQFTVNVGETLGTGGKGGSYLMLTGRADFPRASNNPVGSTIVYVMDTATGNYASYYVPFNRQAMTAGQAQQNTLKLITTGSANPVIDRDALR